jgi:hypothetical protein
MNKSASHNLRPIPQEPRPAHQSSASILDPRTPQRQWRSSHGLHDNCHTSFPQLTLTFPSKDRSRGIRYSRVRWHPPAGRKDSGRRRRSDEGCWANLCDERFERVRLRAAPKNTTKLISASAARFTPISQYFGNSNLKLPSAILPLTCPGF